MTYTEEDFDDAFDHWYKQMSDPEFITKRNYEIMVTKLTSKARQMGLTLELYYERYPEDLL